MNSEDVKLSKSLSWLLRHGAVKEGLRISPEGYLDVDTVLQHKSFQGYNYCDIERVVRNNEKQRFQLRVDPGTRSLQIKANQGHTIHTVTDAELTPILEAKYPFVIHGTFSKCWPQIKQSGLSRMQRRHIHLAKGLGDTVISGLRRNAQIHIYINLEKALQDGIKFFESDNGVILTPGSDKGYLETKYFDKVVEASTARVAPSRAATVPVMELVGAARPSRPPFPPHVAARPAPPAFPPLPRAPRPAPEAWRRAPAPPRPPLHRDIARIVQVSGFPIYTQPQDLAHAFREFGPVTVDSIAEGVAALAFATPEEAMSAVRASEAVNIYGEFLTVRPYNRGMDQPARQKDAPKARPKAATVDPASLPWAGHFHAQLDAVLAAVRLSPADVQRLATLYRDLEAVLQAAWPGCRAIPFGSVTTGLGVKSSDADCFVLLPRAAVPTAVPRARRELARHPRVFTELLAIPRANTPIVKCYHLPTRTHCDLSFKTPLGAQNSKLISFLLYADPRLIPIAVTIKYYASVHDLTGTGKLTNYALTMLIIFYLQQRNILPPVEWLQRDRNNDFIVDYWNTGFMDNHAMLPPNQNTASIAELLGGFFEYYSTFDFDQLVVCPFLGRAIPKELFKNSKLLPVEFERYKVNVGTGSTLAMRFNTAMCVQDPFEQCHNVASPVTTRLSADIRTYFKFAADAYEKEKLVNCQNFLKIILLEKPKLQHGRTSPEYRVTMSPAHVNAIIDPDWKAIARDVVFLAFETILKVKLKNLPDTSERNKNDNPESKNGKKQVKQNKVAVKKQGNVDAKKEKDDSSTNEQDPNTKKEQDDSATTKEEANSSTKKEEANSSTKKEEANSSTQKEANPSLTKEANPSTKKEAPPGAKKEPEKATAKKERHRPKRVKEKYTGLMTRTVWKRKQYAKLFSVMALRFQDREEKITEEILKFDKNVINSEFQLIITFRDDPRTVMVSIRYIAGEPNNYREFGKFLLSTMQQWFVTLLKPHCNPTKRERKKKTKKEEEEKKEELEQAGEKLDSDDSSAEIIEQPPDVQSDSDSVSSYEDERIDPRTQQTHDTDKSQSDNSNPSDANKENVHASNTDDKTKKHSAHGSDKNRNDRVKQESDDDKSPDSGYKTQNTESDD